MPASGAQDAKRGRLLQGFFWGGVGLATLAMLVLLFSQSVVVLRVAVILCVVAIMMLAISIVLRPSVEMVRVDIEEHLIGEVERVRMRARDDIGTAARNTHRVLSEKIHVLTATVDALRAQIDELKVNAMFGGGAAAGPHIGPASTSAGVVHRTETVQVTRRTTTVDPGDDATRGTVYGSRSAVDGEWSDERGEDRGTRPRTAESDRSSPPAEDGYGEADWEATFRSLSRQQSALPASPGRPASWYTGAEDELSRSRGRERESRHERERESRHDREPDHGRHSDPDHGRHSEPGYGRHSDRHSDQGRERDRQYDPERRYDLERETRQDFEREYERRRDHDGYRDAPHDRYRDRGPDRYRDDEGGRHERHDDRDRDYDRERDYERDRDHDRGYGRSRERDRYDGDADGYGRAYDHPSDRHLPRPRSPHATERER